MVFLQAGEVQVGEDIAQQDQSPEAEKFQQALRLARAADLRTQVQVAEDQRIGWPCLHAPDYVQLGLQGGERMMNIW